MAAVNDSELSLRKKPADVILHSFVANTHRWYYIMKILRHGGSAL